MSTQYTPGPWTAFDHPLGVGVTSKVADVAHCDGFHSWRTRAEEFANARLIASAPDLLAALSSLLNCVDGQHEPDQLDRCKQRAREALAAATTPG